MAVSPVFVLALLGILLGLLAAGLHQVPEGHIAVYYIGGKLADGDNDPGWHWSFPGLYTPVFVQITLQTDQVLHVGCGTSTGVMINFDRIEVVNVLDRKKAHATVKRFGANYDKTFIFDKVAFEINQFCSSNTLHEVYISKFSTLDEELAAALQVACDKFDTGIQIVAVRVTKPRIPEAVRQNYERVEAASSELQVAAREQEVTRKREETEKLRQTIAAQRDAEIAVLNAEKEANVTIIQTRKLIEKKKGEAEISRIENEMLLEKLRAETDAMHHRAKMEAEAMKAKLTEPYLRYTLFQALSNNTKIYFGEKIPSIFSDFLTGSAAALTRISEAPSADEPKKQPQQKQQQPRE